MVLGSVQLKNLCRGTSKGSLEKEDTVPQLLFFSQLFIRANEKQTKKTHVHKCNIFILTSNMFHTIPVAIMISIATYLTDNYGRDFTCIVLRVVSQSVAPALHIH